MKSLVNESTNDVPDGPVKPYLDHDGAFEVVLCHQRLGRIHGPA